MEQAKERKGEQGCWIGIVAILYRAVREGVAGKVTDEQR